MKMLQIRWTKVVFVLIFLVCFREATVAEAVKNLLNIFVAGMFSQFVPTKLALLADAVASLCVGNKLCLSLGFLETDKSLTVQSYAVGYFYGPKVVEIVTVQAPLYLVGRTIFSLDFLVKRFFLKRR